MEVREDAHLLIAIDPYRDLVNALEMQSFHLQRVAPDLLAIGANLDRPTLIMGTLRASTVSVARVKRDGEVVFEGKISSLKRIKDDVKQVASGFDCGIGIDGFDSIQEKDIIEAYAVEEIARSLE